MRKLNFNGDVLQVFHQLDADDSGELSLEEIDNMGAFVWSSFRRWAVEKFDGPIDFLQRFTQEDRKSPRGMIARRNSEKVQKPEPPSPPAKTRFSIAVLQQTTPERDDAVAGDDIPKRSGSLQLKSIKSTGSSMGVRHSRTDGSPRSRFGSNCDPLSPRNTDAGPSLSMEQFIAGMRSEGWEAGFEEMLYNALDLDNNGTLNAKDLKWLEVEKKRQTRKENAKRKAEQEQTKSRSIDWRSAEAALENFKQFLKRRHGSYIRAWRVDLCPEEQPDTMVLSKGELFKALHEIGWVGDVRLLYKILDKDDSGYIALSELDPEGAEGLAHFKYFIDDKFGGAANAFKALDKYNVKKVKQQEFLNAVKGFGFHFNARQIFHGFDRSGTKRVVEEDLLFLDKWKPAAYLCNEPNPRALDEFKALLERQYKTYLKAWRHVLDIDASNRCSFDEFTAACKKMHYNGDVAGVWRAIDDDVSGFITLYEIDPTSSNTLRDFRDWCAEEFGGVRYAFEVFDASGDNEVNYREFRRACRIYGYQGRPHPLFHALDVEQNGSLSLEEVVFLDRWEFHWNKGDKHAGDEETEGVPEANSSPVRSTDNGGSSCRAVHTTMYVTDAPGPGSYNVPCAFGGSPGSVTHFPGACSFGKKIEKTDHLCNQRLPGVHLNRAESVHGHRDGPSAHTYNSMAFTAVSPSHPNWGFGTEKRKAANVKAEDTGPGPADYFPRRRKGLAVGCTPRRPLKLHPLFRGMF
jgi:Ca2+-binding EF-hand superfamily protein